MHDSTLTFLCTKYIEYLGGKYLMRKLPYIPELGLETLWFFGNNTISVCMEFMFVKR